jgi:hypothetical protein
VPVERRSVDTGHLQIADHHVVGARVDSLDRFFAVARQIR